MISVDTDFSGLRRAAACLIGLIVAIWRADPWVILMWSLAAYYILEDHRHYLLAKSYRKLGKSMKRAINS